MNKLFIGIALVAFPQSMTWVGMGAAVIGLLALTTISMGSSWYLIKARNYYKGVVIRDLADLGEITYGPWMKHFCNFILILSQLALLTAYLLYLGTQAKLVSCQLDKCSDADW